MEDYFDDGGDDGDDDDDDHDDDTNSGWNFLFFPTFPIFFFLFSVFKRSVFFGGQALKERKEKAEKETEGNRGERKIRRFSPGRMRRSFSERLATRAIFYRLLHFRGGFSKLKLFAPKKNILFSSFSFFFLLPFSPLTPLHVPFFLKPSPWLPIRPVFSIIFTHPRRNFFFAHLNFLKYLLIGYLI